MSRFGSGFSLRFLGELPKCSSSGTGVGSGFGAGFWICSFYTLFLPFLLLSNEPHDYVWYVDINELVADLDGMSALVESQVLELESQASN